MPDDIQNQFEIWKSDPSPANLHGVVQKLSPTINYTLSSIGADNDPLLRQEALLLAGEAVKNYDPSKGAGLPTWVSQQLMQLRRIKRSLNSPIKVPERHQLDAMHIQRIENEFMDKHNREPDVHELADAAKMSVKRIEKVRKAMRKVPTEGTLPDIGQTETPSFDEEALRYVYEESDYIDRKILEHKTGYGGQPVLKPLEIAKKLNLTPSQLSRRSAKLAFKINELTSTLEQVA